MKNYYRKALFSALLCLLFLAPARSHAQEGDSPLNTAQPAGITSQEIINRFSAKEKQFKGALENYIYRRTVKIQTLDGDTPDGEYQQTVDILFDDKAKRIENVVFAPQPTLTRIGMSREDFDDIQNRLPFVLTSDEVNEYNVIYAGQQKIDELDTYVFDVAPKSIQKGKRYFDGRIWVDNRDFQIVKTTGKTVPDIRPTKKGKGGDENLFPTFTTYREQVDGKYWFPTYTRADDTLHFSNGDIRIRIIIKYFDYQHFGTEIAGQKTTFEGKEVKGKPQDKPAPNEPPK